MIIDAILKINPNAKVTVNAEDYNQITWHDGTTYVGRRGDNDQRSVSTITAYEIKG